MKAKIFILIAALFAAALFAQFAAADVSKGVESYSISKVYGPSANVTGWINISLESEPADSAFTATFNDDGGKSITLGELLALSPSYTYTCSPLDCKPNYVASNEEESKKFIMGVNETKMIGIKLDGKVQEIDSAALIVKSNASSSCVNQLGIDLFGDGNLDFSNTKVSDGLCGSKDYGCFDAGRPSSEFKLNGESDEYCQRINFTESPGFRVGAWVKKISGSSNIQIDVFDENKDRKGTCTLPEVTGITGEEYSCDIDFVVTEPTEYYVCIYTSGDGEYKIRGYGSSSDSDSCGFNGAPPRDEVAAYQIFSQGKQFDSFGAKTFPNKLPDNQKLSDKISNYLAQRYEKSNEKVDCSSAEGCVVPIILNSAVSQEVLIVMNIDYKTDAGSTTANLLYDLSETAAKITSNPKFQRLFLDSAGIGVPNKVGKTNFELIFGGDKIVSEKIEIKNVPIIRSLSPSTAATAVPTTFKVDVDVPKNVSVLSYSWQFGNTSMPEITKSNVTSHTFTEIGEQEIKIIVTDTRGLSSTKTFSLNVTSPKDWINETLGDLEGNLKAIKSQIKKMSVFEQSSINSVLDLDKVSSKIETIRDDYSAASANDTKEYERIAGELIGLRVPKKVILTSQAISPLLPEDDYVDLDFLKIISGGHYDEGDSGAYKDAILFWQYENLNASLRFKEFSAEHDSGTEKLVKIFELEVKEKKNVPYDYYLVIPDLEGLDFDRSAKKGNGFRYINLNKIAGVPKKVQFYTTEDIRITNLPAFISPAMSRLAVGREKGIPIDEQGISRKTILIISLVFLLVIGIISYIFLQQWYKKKYEKHLFKNKNDLYNIVHYINNAKKKGLTNEEITEKLNKAKWTHEQIRYGLRKYEGKRTGMVELPLPRAIKKMGGPDKGKGKKK